MVFCPLSPLHSSFLCSLHMQMRHFFVFLVMSDSWLILISDLISCFSKTSPDRPSVPHWTCGLRAGFALNGVGSWEWSSRIDHWQRDLLIVWLFSIWCLLSAQENMVWWRDWTARQNQVLEHFIVLVVKLIAENMFPSGAQWVHWVCKWIDPVSVYWSSSMCWGRNAKWSG